MSNLDTPIDIANALRDYYTCELTTVNSSGYPVSWPCLSYFHEATGQIVMSTSIAFPVKAFNARKHPAVSLLYSDLAGVSDKHMPAVLVQGQAFIKEMLEYDDPLVVGLFRVSQQRQPDMGRMIGSRFMLKLFSWYLFQRLLIIVEPQIFSLWPERDFAQLPQRIEVSHVE